MCPDVKKSVWFFSSFTCSLFKYPADFKTLLRTFKALFYNPPALYLFWTFSHRHPLRSSSASNSTHHLPARLPWSLKPSASGTLSHKTFTILTRSRLPNLTSKHHLFKLAYMVGFWLKWLPIYLVFPSWVCTFSLYYIPLPCMILLIFDTLGFLFNFVL